MRPAGTSCVSRRGLDKGPIDEALKPFGLEREIVTIVGGFSTALALARASDLIASVPERHTGNLRAGMHSFPLPVAMPEITVSLLWHPRLDADPAHRWLRGCVREICAEPGLMRGEGNPLSSQFRIKRFGERDVVAIRVRDHDRFDLFIRRSIAHIHA